MNNVYSFPRNKYQQIKVLRDFPPERVIGPVFRAGEIVWGRVVEPPPGCRGFKGWDVARSTTDPNYWRLEDGVDAVAVGPVQTVDR